MSFSISQIMLMIYVIGFVLCLNLTINIIKKEKPYAQGKHIASAFVSLFWPIFGLIILAVPITLYWRNKK